MAEELPVDLRTRRGAPPGPPLPAPQPPSEASLPLRKRRSAMRGALGGDGPPPSGKAPRGCPPAPPPAFPLGFPPPPAAFFAGLRGELPLPLQGGAGAGLVPPPGILALPPAPPLAVLGPPQTQIAADIAAATGQDEDGDTALHIAVAQGAVGAARRLVGLFLQGGCHLDVFNRLRQTPLHVAVITRQAALVRLLVAHGACPGARDRLGRTAPHLACERRAPRCLRELLRGGPDLQARDYEGLTPLHVAVSSGARENVLLLLEHGADIDAVDIKSGRSPLLHAVESNSLEMAELLIQRGASVNAQSYAGCTALHAAAGRGLLGVLRLLLRSGADCGIKNYHNETPLAVASSRQVIDILRGKASRPPQPRCSPLPLPDAPTPASNGRASPGSGARIPPAANQKMDFAEPANGVQGVGPCAGVKHEGGAGQPMACASGHALSLPLAEARLDPACLYPMASPPRDSSANPLVPPRFHRPIVSLGPPANEGLGQAAQMDQSWTLVEGETPPLETPRLRLREGRGQVRGGR